MYRQIQSVAITVPMESGGSERGREEKASEQPGEADMAAEDSGATGPPTQEVQYQKDSIHDEITILKSPYGPAQEYDHLFSHTIHY